MDLKQSLDNYLTSGPPDDGFTEYCDQVDELFTDGFFNKNEDWILDGAGQANKWLSKLFDRDVEPEKAAKIIERAFNLYQIKSKK